MAQNSADALFAPWDSAASPGVVWAATQGGREVLSGAVGMADISNAVPLDRRSVIRIGSQTKQFTVLLALMLEAEGKLSMEDEVHRYAPWLPAYPYPVTLRHLATNTSGLRDFLEIMVYAGLPLGSAVTRARQRELIAGHREVNFRPGERMIYCNTGFMLLSDIVEEVSGRSYNELLEARITGPLGMSDTRLMWRDAEIWPRLATQHLKRADGGWETTRWGFDLGGEGGMVSTLDDMLTWQRNFTAPVVGSEALFARMATPVVYANGVTGKYAWGLTNEPYRGHTCIAHGGSVAGGKSESVRFPAAGVGVVLLANFDAMVPTSFTRRIADGLLGTVRSVSAAAERLTAAAGVYRLPGTGEIIGIRAIAGEPHLVTGSGAARMEEVAPGEFAPERAIQHLVLRLTADGALEGTSCGAAVRFERLATMDGTPATLGGIWRSAATGLMARIDPGLRLTIQSESGQSRLLLRWLAPDLLAAAPETAPQDAWTSTLRLDGERLEFTTDRTKGLFFTRAD